MVRLLKKKWPRRILLVALVSGILPAKKFMQSGQVQKFLGQYGYEVKKQTPAATDQDLKQFEATVAYVSDGDSLKLKRNGETIKVRLFGIDAPEKGQVFANQSRQHLTNLARHKQVKVSVVDKDRFDRLVANVWLEDGRMLNHEMVKSGFAWWYDRYAPGDTELKALQSEAKRSKSGLWQVNAPVPPWEYKAKRRSQSW